MIFCKCCHSKINDSGYFICDPCVKRGCAKDFVKISKVEKKTLLEILRFRSDPQVVD